MSDRELLALAAKAAGYDIRIPGNSDLLLIGGLSWHPLMDDGDCARLEAACGIDVEWWRVGVVAHGPETARMREAYADHANHRQAARRRASVRAAAEIGKGMGNG